MRMLVNQYRNMAYNLDKIISLYRDGCFINVIYDRGDEVLADYNTGKMAEKVFQKILVEIAKNNSSIIMTPTNEDEELMEMQGDKAHNRTGRRNDTSAEKKG